ncbi:MAG: hypothetical protein K5873_09915 [Treponema sp.]|nr:hypothetical protein [Treponema sp.]
MAIPKVNKKINQYVLRGKLRQEGFELWRYVFSAISKTSGHERKFFIELYIVNPGLSPKVAVISQKSRLAVSESDLQYALAGTESASHANDELDVKPSYVLVKAGAFGTKGKCINKFLPSSSFSYVKNNGSFKAGDCQFSDKALLGSVEVTPQDLRIRPELLCNDGRMDWELKFERTMECGALYNRKALFWAPLGIKSFFSGFVHLDGEEYVVLPKSSNGYIDKSWGISPNSPYFHLSSSKLMSVISGKQMTSSCFAIEGEFGGKLSAMFNIEGNVFTIENKGIFKKNVIIHDCSQISDNSEGDRVHWTVSVHKGKYVIDVDVFCNGKDMFVRDYEMPHGKRCLLKILAGLGHGEIRMYKKIGKNLELLEHANIVESLCEYGQSEEVGK